MDIKQSPEYLELLCNAGQSLQHVELFINTIQECDLFRVNMSSKRKAIIKDYLRKQLLDDKALAIIDEYTKLTKYVSTKLAKAQPITDEQEASTLQLIEEELKPL
jgi:hypothetical protein